jgi:hypothetical protein
VTAFQDECSRDLEAAEPIIKEAEAALNSLDKASLGELKSFGSPAAEVVNVVSACMVLTSPGGKIPKVALKSFPKLHKLQISSCCLATNSCNPIHQSKSLELQLFDGHASCLWFAFKHTANYEKEKQ